MDISSFNLRDLWKTHGRNIKRYGLFVLIVIAGLRTSDWLTAWIGLAGLFCIYAYDRWGAYWDESGRQLLFPAKVLKEQQKRAGKEPASEENPS